jgi:hypothetical protein
MAREASNRGVLELLKTLPDRITANLHRIHDLLRRSLNSMIPSRNQNGGPSNASGLTPTANPVAVHALNQTCGSKRHALILRPKVQLRSESMDQQTWISDWDLLSQSLSPDDFSDSLSKFV